MKERNVVIIIIAFFGILAVANGIYFGWESAGESLTYSLIEAPIVYGVYRLIKYFTAKKKTSAPIQ